MWIAIKGKAGGLMKPIPYGYDIVDGKAVINGEEAQNVKAFYEGYIAGSALTVAARAVGLHICHSSAGKMLRNKRYLGDEF